MRPEINDLIKDVAERRSAFYATLDGQDDLGVVVRAHIAIEQELRHFIKIKAPCPEFVDFKEMDYNATLTLAMMLGLPKDLRPLLAALGSLRNKFSHRMNMVLRQSDAADLYAKLGKAAQKDLQVGLRSASAKHPDREGDPKNMTPKELLAVTCGYLHLLVMGAATAAAHAEVLGKDASRRSIR
jgi:hypothetical protein